MLTVVEFESFSDLVLLLCRNNYLPPFDVLEVEVDKYTYDPRIEWDTYIVTIGGNAIGFTNGPVKLDC